MHQNVEKGRSLLLVFLSGDRMIAMEVTIHNEYTVLRNSFHRISTCFRCTFSVDSVEGLLSMEPSVEICVPLHKIKLVKTNCLSEIQEARPLTVEAFQTETPMLVCVNLLALLE